MNVENYIIEDRRLEETFLKFFICVWHDQFPYRVMGCQVCGVAVNMHRHPPMVVYLVVESIVVYIPYLVPARMRSVRLPNWI